MSCPSCGALKIDDSHECGAVVTELNSSSEPESQFLPTEEQQTKVESQGSRLLEFPGVSRAGIPTWRKELSEKVREIQEKRARETLDSELIGNSEATPQLELLPPAVAPNPNPLVTAALKRIERANLSSSTIPEENVVIAAVAAAAESKLSHRQLDPGSVLKPKVSEPAMAPAQVAPISQGEEKPTANTPKLVVVPSANQEAESAEKKIRPVRVIGDDLTDPALNYLDTVPTTIRVEDVSRNRAPVHRRFLSAFVDLIVLGFLCLPFVALVELGNGNWRDPRTLTFAFAVLVVMSFIYSTVCTALTGRTIGQRLLSLRVVDARTGLIPTGKQSAGRAFLYVFSLLSAGLALLLTVFDADGRPVHDRLTRTSVIRA